MKESLDEQTKTETTSLLGENGESTLSNPPNKKSTGQSILELAIPTAGALLIDPLMTLADTAFVGRFSDSGADQLAGMGSSAALLTFSFYLFNFLCTATTPLVSLTYMGRLSHKHVDTHSGFMFL